MLANALSEYRIRAYQPGDEKAIINLFTNVFGQDLTLTQWRWKYHSTQTDTVYAKVVIDGSDRMIGHAGAIMLWGCCNATEIPFFQICDVMIHPEHRGYLGDRNLFTALVRQLLDTIAQRFPQAFCYGFPGRRPFSLGARARVYASIETAVETVRTPRLSHYRLRTVPLSWDDNRLDRLWLQLAPQYTLSLRRDRCYLQWRYCEHPFFSYRIIGLGLLGRLLGWAIVRQENNRMLVVDLLIPQRWLRPALAALDKFALSSNGDIHSIHIWLPLAWRSHKLGQLQTTPVVTSHMIWNTKFATTQVQQELYYTMGDLDIF